VIPENHGFSAFGATNIITNKRVEISPTGNAARQLVYSTVNPILSNGTQQSFLGNPTAGLFPNSNAYVFNYYNTLGNPGVIPGAGQSGQGDYRIHFSTLADTSVKNGDFGLSSMYIAIGTGNSATLTIQGFRAGKMVTQQTLSLDGVTSVCSVTGFNYAASDGFSGTTLSFGTNWQFLDGITILAPNTNIPVFIDDLSFAGATAFAPSTHASSLALRSVANRITSTTAKLQWANGSGDSRAVFVKATTSGDPGPSDGTVYTANTAFGSGSQTAAGWYCVYNGTGTSVDITGLTAGTNYRVAVVEYNGSVGNDSYFTSTTPAEFNFTTVSIPSTSASSVTATPSLTDFTQADISWTSGTGPPGWYLSLLLVPARQLRQTIQIILLTPLYCSVVPLALPPGIVYTGERVPVLLYPAPAAMACRPDKPTG
jgi:hypothetical protein